MVKSLVSSTIRRTIWSPYSKLHSDIIKNIRPVVHLLICGCLAFQSDVWVMRSWYCYDLEIDITWHAIWYIIIEEILILLIYIVSIPNTSSSIIGISGWIVLNCWGASLWCKRLPTTNFNFKISISCFQSWCLSFYSKLH